MYRTWMDFIQFITDKQLNGNHPCEIAELYCAQKHLQGYKVSSVLRYINSFEYFFMDMGWPDLRKDRQMQKLTASFKREFKNKGQDTRLPITSKLLYCLHQGVEKMYQSWYSIRMIQALFTTAFFGLFRMAELVSNHQTTKTLTIQYRDVEVEEDCVKLTLRQSKTTTKPAVIKLRRRVQGLCPVRALKKYLNTRGKYPGQLFIHVNHDPLTANRADKALKQGSHMALCRALFGSS